MIAVKPFACTVAVLTVALLSSCASTRRAGKDLGIVAASPVIVPYGGFTDGYAAAQEVAEGLDGGAAAEVLAMPFTSAYHLAKHAVCVTVHALDFFAYPIYGAAELHPQGPEIEPLDYYTGTPFDKPSGMDAETGAVSR